MAVKEDESLSLTDHEIDVEDVDDVRPAVTALKKESIDQSETDQINRNRNLKNCSSGSSSNNKKSNNSTNGGGKKSGSKPGSCSSGSSSSSSSASNNNPLIKARCNSDHLRLADCHLETKELWDKFNELGTEMIITKTGRSVRLTSFTLLTFQLPNPKRKKLKICACVCARQVRKVSCRSKYHTTVR